MELRQSGSFSLLSTTTNLYGHHCPKLVFYTSAQGGLIINTASAAGIIFGDQDPALVGFDILDLDYLQDRVHFRCDRCNNKLTDLDWSKIKSKGWDAEIVKHAPFCSSCIDQWRVL